MHPNSCYFSLDNKSVKSWRHFINKKTWNEVQTLAQGKMCTHVPAVAIHGLHCCRPHCFHYPWRPRHLHKHPFVYFHSSHSHRWHWHQLLSRAHQQDVLAVLNLLNLTPSDRNRHPWLDLDSEMRRGRETREARGVN